MAEFDDLLGDVIAEVPAAPKSEYTDSTPIDPEDEFFDKTKLAKFIADTMSVPFEGISDTIIHRGYAAVVWHFRQAAIVGDIDRARSLKMWLDWAEPRIDRQRKPTDTGARNPGTAAFLPREVK